VAALLAMLTVVAGLIAYKASTSLTALARARASGSLSPKPGWIDAATVPALLRPLAAAANYFGWVLIALAFGIVLGATVRAFLPRRWLTATVGAPGARGQVAAALAGAPLMLCSCCAAPVFEGVYDRTRRLGSALALLVASPALNPAALALTFMVFEPSIATTRLVVSIVLVLLATALLGRRHEAARPMETTACAIERDDSSWRALGASFASSLREVSARSLPAIALGVIISVLLLGVLPEPVALRGDHAAVTIFIVSAVAVPIALPTFAEIPLALGLLHAGLPAGAALALLVAGPAINLPSLLTVHRVASGRAALATGLAVFALAATGGLLLEILG
jgi:hypothetical protein